MRLGNLQASGLQQAGAVIDAQNRPGTDSFPTVCARALIWVKGWYEAKVGATSGGGPPFTFGEQSVGMMDLSCDMMHYNEPDYMDGMFWQELMADFSFVPMQQFSAKETG
jgi:hypothetical protein